MYKLSVTIVAYIRTHIIHILKSVLIYYLFVKNSTHFVNLLAEIEERMVSFDVTSLFTKVPIQEALEVTAELLQKDTALTERTDLSPETIIKLLKKCLSTTYFRLGDSFYEQTEGAAMGSSLSPIIANIYGTF